MTAPACLVDSPRNLSSQPINATALLIAFELSPNTETATLIAGVVSSPLLPSGALAAPAVSVNLQPGDDSYVLGLDGLGGGALPVYWQVLAGGCGATQMVVTDVQVALQQA